jgi:hypothetical protein
VPIRFSPLSSCVILCGLIAMGPIRGQDLREQPTPFSTLLEFQSLGPGNPPRQALPIWLESLQKATEPINSTTPQKTTFRIRLRRLGQLNDHLQLRLFFDDLPDAAPIVTGWSETGAQQYQSPQLGAGLGLATSETLIIPASNVDYLDITVPGNGSNVRSAFLATMKEAGTLHGLDFDKPADAEDPFSNLRKAEPAAQDSYLYGRVKASLESPAASLTPTNRAGLAWEFELDAIPLLVVIGFEILDADPLAPPEWTVNGRPLGPAAVHLPDLSDPAYQGIVRPLQRDVHFQYNGWLRGQQAIPGSALRVGLNKIVLRLTKDSEPVAVRAVELQFKHHWQHLDYKLAP